MYGCLDGGLLGILVSAFFEVAISNSRQLDAPKLYRKSRKVGIRPGEFLAFS